MASKLAQITSGYHTFVDNQVLTEDQLNEFVSYFDDQDRLTRVFLHGVGVVCGFKLSYSNTKITLSQGVGITTDGDLIQLKNPITGSKEKTLVEASLSYTHFRKFKDDKAFYSPFRKVSGTSTVTLEMYELFTQSGENTKALSELANWKNMEVVLYLESFDDEGDLCTAIDCDNQGIEQLNRLKVLLMPEPEAEYLTKSDAVFSTFDCIDNYFKLPAPAVKRVVLNTVYTTKYEDLKRAYNDAIADGNTIVELKEGISALVHKFSKLLGLSMSKSDLSFLLSKLDSIVSFKTYYEPFDVQYRYDFLKDLVDTYNEIIVLLLDIRQLCLPDIMAFPKHLLLGLLSETGTEPKHLRHQFYPAATAAAETRERAASLFEKMLVLIKNYTIKSGEILITPSNKLKQLSRQSIPFYYQVNASLLKAWDYDKTRIFRQSQQLTYHRDSVADLPQLRDPLTHNTDRFDFYRIEGHQGKDYRDVLEELNDQKKKFGLAFDVKALSVNINTENLDIDDYECEFEDLKVMLKAWNAEQDCILAQVASFFSSFSTSVPGANAKEAELDLKSGVRVASYLTNYTARTPLTDTVKTLETNAVIAGLAGENTVVQDNMSVVENTLGVEMKLAIEETKGGSVNDLIANAQGKIQEKVNTDEWNADPDLKEFVAGKSVELMAHTYVLTQRMPASVSVVDTNKVSDYKLSLSQLCALVQKLKAGYQSVQLTVGLRAFVGLLINQLSAVCCSGKKLEVLLEEVSKRKEQILLRLQLSKFIEQHPGLEHKAGVEPGGTFVLVYKNKETVTEVASDRTIAAEEIAASKDALSRQLTKLDSMTAAERISVYRGLTDLINYENYSLRLDEIKALDKVISTAQLPDNTVVADFALPYLCCSNCATINYIIAKPVATLRLNRDKYCLLSDNGPVLFEVSPADGLVEASPATSGLTIEAGRIVIVPDAFDPEMLGKSIRFTVNQQLTDAVLTVYRGVLADFSVPEEPTSEATHRFEATGKNLEGASFFWDFGDGETSKEATPTHTYKLPVNDENKVTVTLTVTAANGICKTTVNHDIVFVEIKPSIDLIPKEFCENDKDPYSFIVTPPGAKVEISGPGVDPDTGQFVPAAAPVGEVKFLLNGEDSGLMVNVVAAPKAVCHPEQVENQLIISNLSTNANKFEWTINGSVLTTTNLDPIPIELKPDSPTDWNIILVASGASVCPNSRTTAKITTKYVEPQTDTCIEEAKVLIETDAKRLFEISADPNSVVFELLERTRKLFGGTADYTDGVRNNLELYLNGGANDKLEELFAALWKDTEMMIVEMNGNAEIQAQLIQLFEWQLRLFYLILGCQKTESIEAFLDLISSLLKQIIDSLTILKEWKIVFSNVMKEFIKKYAEKVADIPWLSDHIKQIMEQELI